MNANKIETGKTYIITVGKNQTTVKVVSVDRRVNGQLAYDCLNVNTNKRLTVTDAKRFVKEVKANDDTAKREKIADALAEAGAAPEHVEAARTAMAIQAVDAKGKGGKKKGTISGLDAAAQVLADSEVPLNVKQITERAMDLGWAPEGKTPMNTLSAAIQMEIKKKGDASRFAKVDKGLFARK